MILERHEFLDWLYEFEPEAKPFAKIGLCPLEQFLKHKYPRRGYYIGTKNLIRGETKQPLPAWAANAVYLFDTHKTAWAKITAATAIEILKSCK